MGRIVIACYRPKTGKADLLTQVVGEHWSHLRREGLVTERKPIVGRASDGTMIEVFEWASREAIQAAHDNAAVQRIWERFAEVCDHVPIGQVPEASELFSEFAPM